MAYTNEPHGLQLINNVNMTTFGAFITQVCWFFGSTLFTLVACYLLLNQMNDGFALASALIGGWTLKTGANVVDANNKRKTAPEYGQVLAAKAQGEAAAADAAVARKSGMFTAVTGEHEIPPLPTRPKKGK